MIVSSTLDAKWTALPQYDLQAVAGRKSRSPYPSGASQEGSIVASNLPMLVPPVPVPTPLPRDEASVVDPEDHRADRVSVTSLRPGKASSGRTVLWQEDSFGIRDRVTISSEAYARTAPRNITYDRNGNLSSIVPPQVPTGAVVYAGTTRDQATLALKPPPGAVRRGGRSEPAQLLAWFSPNSIPEPA